MNSLPFYRFRRGIAAFLVFIFSSLHVAQAAVAEKAETAVPLAVGAISPGVMLKAVGGVDFDLGAAMAAKPTVLIFYRGGWCPYCNTQLAELQKYQDQFVALGYQILAISTDAPEAMPATVEKNALSYTLLSDHAMNAAEAFGIAWKVPAETASKYASRGIQLAPIPGSQGLHWLPVPSVFIIGKDKVIKAMFSDPNFKVRSPVASLLAAAQSAIK